APAHPAAPARGDLATHPVEEVHVGRIHPLRGAVDLHADGPLHRLRGHRPHLRPLVGGIGGARPQGLDATHLRGGDALVTLRDRLRRRSGAAGPREVARPGGLEGTEDGGERDRGAELGRPARLSDGAPYRLPGATGDDDPTDAGSTLWATA